MSTFPKHARRSHPCFSCVYNMRGAINAFQQKCGPTLCVACLTDKRISLPITQCANRPDESRSIFPISCRTTADVYRILSDRSGLCASGAAREGCFLARSSTLTQQRNVTNFHLIEDVCLHPFCAIRRLPVSMLINSCKYFH